MTHQGLEKWQLYQSLNALVSGKIYRKQFALPQGDGGLLSIPKSITICPGFATEMASSLLPSLPSFVWLRREGVGRNRLGALFGTPEQQHGTYEICSWLTAVAKSSEFFTKFYLSSEHSSTLFTAPSSASGDCGGSGSSCSAEEIATWSQGEILVGGWPTPLKNMKVSWDH